MRVLTVNVGSSSLKLSVVGGDDVVEVEVEVDAQADHAAALRNFIGGAGTVSAVAHRLVHGGAAIRHAAIVDGTVRRELDSAVTLAPLHVPPALALLDEARAVSDFPQIVCVDRAFHAAMPDCATTYAVPAQWREWGVRRYGFHGLSYAWATRRAAELLGASPDGCSCSSCTRDRASPRVPSITAEAWTPRWDSLRWRVPSWQLAVERWIPARCSGCRTFVGSRPQR